MRTTSILIVDDEAIVRESLTDWLSSKQYNVTAVDDGELALSLITETDYDMVLLDLKLATKSGVEVLREARRYRPNLKTIMITGFPTVESAVESMKLGAVDYLVKPFAPEVLERRIEEALKPRLTYGLIGKAGVGNFVKNLMSAMEVVGVVKKDNKFVFDRLNDPSELVLDYDVTILPPKKYLLPPREDLLKFKIGDPASGVTVAGQKTRVLFGVHPDDLAAIELLDHAFLNVNPDNYYSARRQNTIVVAVDNLKPSPNAFCPSVGTAIRDGGFDLLLTDIGEEYVVTLGSPRGNDIMQKYAEAGVAGDIDVVAAKAEQGKALKRYTLSLNVPVSELPALLERNYESTYWKSKSENCLSCGSCVMVCPTCFCFDVRDEVMLNLTDGVRRRQWDGCVLSDFARTATGENFRHDRASRLRHRIMRKGKYVMDRYQRLGCVGCGRCASVCLPDIASPVKVFNELKEH